MLGVIPQSLFVADVGSRANPTEDMAVKCVHCIQGIEFDSGANSVPHFISSHILSHCLLVNNKQQTL